MRLITCEYGNCSYYMYMCWSHPSGDTETFNMTFISLRNTPLDIYFLVDVSASLQRTINTLRDDIVTIGVCVHVYLRGVCMCESWVIISCKT